ncbi:MAG: ester cyclase [Gaiellales bacterium]
MDAIKVAIDNIEAFSAGNWEEFQAGLSSDSIYEEPATQRRVQGASQIAGAVQGWKQAFPDARGTVKNALESDGTVTLEITWEGTQSGPLEGPGGAIPASGNRISVEAVQVVKVEDDKIVQNRHFFDMLGLLQQIDAVPR